MRAGNIAEQKCRLDRSKIRFKSISNIDILKGGYKKRDSEYIEHFKDKVINNDVILSVPNNAVPNGQIVYTDGNNSVNIFRGDKLDTFTLCLTDDEGDYIDFNGVSSYFTLQFDIFRRYLTKPDKFSNIVNKVNAIL